MFKKNFLLLLSLLMISFQIFSPITLLAAPNSETPAANDITTTTASPEIAAESAILIDAKNKTVLYQKNAYEKHYPASITKLMTALLAIENLDPNDTITFSDTAIYSIEPGSSHIGIQPGEQLSVNDALYALLFMSANEVANGLAEAVSGSIDAFAEKMTERAKELGAKDTHFVNPNGLHDENHYTTAYDMALIASELSKNSYFLDIMSHYMYEIPATNLTDETRYMSQQHRMLNPHRAGHYYREDVIGGKTGFTNEAKHTLVTIAKEGDTVLVVVLLNSGKATLYTDTNALLDYGFSAYQELKLNPTTETLKTLPLYNVKSGKSYQAGNCSIGVAHELSALVPKEMTLKDLTTSFDLPDYVNSTAKPGDIIGKITYLDGSKIIASTDLQIIAIDHLSEPQKSLLPTKVSFKSSYILFIAIGLVFIIFIIWLILYLRRKRKLKTNRLKMSKLFK